jgi:NADH:ubiquinone oxidoreductase subunit F (NADH-binding)
MLTDKDRIFKNHYGRDDWNLKGALKRGVWDDTAKLLSLGREKLIDESKESGLRGRGGAGFPTGMKWSFMPKDDSRDDRPHYLVVNADESEPGTCKDREILRYDPHLLIEGCLVSGFAMGANVAYIYIRGEFYSEASHLRTAIEEAYESGYIGNNACGSGWKFDVYLHRGAGAYICGEETALIASIEGRRAEVDVRPPFPVTEGLYKKPTVVNNVETLAAAAGILINGAEKFSSIGNKKSAGTKLVCFDSFFNNPGVYEIEMGTPMKTVMYDIGGGFKKPIKALQIGGPLGGVLPIEEAEKLNLDFQEFTAAGFMLGHASIVSIPKDFPMVEYIHHLFEFTAEESCGKCFPGRLGSYRGKEMFDQLKSKKAKIPLKLLNELLITMKKGCLCALCGAIPTPIMNILKYFGDEMKNDMVKEN